VHLDVCYYKNSVVGLATIYEPDRPIFSPGSGKRF